MSTVPGHLEIQELLPAAALACLTAAESDGVQAHVARCPQCARILSEYQEVVGTMSLLVPERGFSRARREVVWTRLQARIHQATDIQATDIASVTRPAAALPRWEGQVAGRWAGWAVAAGLGGVLLMHHAVHRPVDYGWLAAGAMGIIVVVLAIIVGMQSRKLTDLQARLAGRDRLVSQAGRIDEGVASSRSPRSTL